MDRDGGFHTRTGFAQIDSMTYEQQTHVDALLHEETSLLMFRATNYGAIGTITSASRSPDEADLLFISRGTGLPVYGQVGGTPFHLAPTRAHRVTFVPKGLDSNVTFATTGLSSNIMFPDGYLSSLIAEIHGVELVPTLFKQNDRLLLLTRQLEEEICHPSFGSRLMVEGLCRAIASLIARVNMEPIAAQAERIHLPQWKVNRRIEYIEAHLDQSIGLNDLAGIAGLSTFHFARVFKQATGTSPYQFVRDRRIERSQTLLIEGEMEMSQLALACGFASQSHFTAAFTKAIGKSPGRYRRDHRS
jgi:AraC family transcriptional regulator